MTWVGMKIVFEKTGSWGGYAAHLESATPEALLNDLAEAEGLDTEGKVWRNTGGRVWELQDQATEPLRPVPQPSAQLRTTLAEERE